MISSSLCPRGECKCRHAVQCLTRLQQSRRKRWLVRRIRIVLSLKAESRALLMRLACLPKFLSIQKVPRVELHSRLGCRNREHSSTHRFIGPCCRFHFAVFATQYPVVIVPPGDLQLRMVVLYPGCSIPCFPLLALFSRSGFSPLGGTF